ncbi:hypothetical protein ACFX1T_027497 [Malus domestica]
MTRVKDPGTYLGILAGWGKTKMVTLSYIKDRVLSKIQGWRNKFLSQASREVLIKAMVQAVPTYPMNVFCFPDRLCKDIDGAIAKFWWANSDKARGIHWVNWRGMGMPKCDGGIGFKNFGDFNLTFLAKQSWCLIQEPNSLWAWVFKDRYFPNSSFLEAKRGGKHDESTEHLLILCPWVEAVWFGGPLGFQLDWNFISLFDAWLLGVGNGKYGSKLEKARCIKLAQVEVIASSALMV